MFSFEYPPSSPTSPFGVTMFHNSVFYYFDVTDCRDGNLCPPLGDQHQHSLVAHYSPYDDCLSHYEHCAQLSALPFFPSSSSSELNHVLMETPSLESQPINQHVSINSTFYYANWALCHQCWYLLMCHPNTAHNQYHPQCSMPFHCILINQSTHVWSNKHERTISWSHDQIVIPPWLIH